MWAMKPVRIPSFGGSLANFILSGKEVSEVTPLEGWAFVVLCVVAAIAVIFVDIRRE